MTRWVKAYGAGVAAAMMLATALTGAPAQAQDGAIKLFDAADAAPAGDPDLPPCPPETPGKKPSKKKKKADKKCRPATSLVIEGADGAVTVGGGGGVGFGGVVRVPFTRRGQALFVKVQVQGHRAWMLVDTGASFTTLTPGFAREAGVTPDADAPSTILSTANGQVRSSFGLIPSLRFGERVHGNVTFTLCPTCGAGRLGELPVVGLLGMNVLGRYRMTVNNDDSTLELTPGADYDERWRDLQPWLRQESRTFVNGYRNKRALITVTTALSNHSRSTIQAVRMRYTCAHPDGTTTVFSSASVSVPPRRRKPITTEATLERGACVQITADIVSARW